MIANDELGYGWQTYPERLQAAGDQLEDLPGHRRRPGRRRRLGLDGGSVHRQLRRQLAAVLLQLPERDPGQPAVPDGLAPEPTSTRAAASSTSSPPTSHSGQLPSVSWIVAPEAYTEHPAWPAGYGAWYTAGVLNALTSDPEVWSKTALLITFDENDGFFDHVVGPYPNVRRPGRPFDGAARRRAVRRQRRNAGRLRRGRRAVRSRRPRAAARRLAVEHRRLGLLGDVRPHVADPLHRGAVRRRRAEHHSVAAGRMRRSDLGVRFRERVRSRAAAPQRRRLQAESEHDSAELPPGAAGGRIGPDPGAGAAAVAPARLPLRCRLRRRAEDAQSRDQEPRPARRRPPGTVADGRRRALRLHGRRRRQDRDRAAATRAPTT